MVEPPTIGHWLVIYHPYMVNNGYYMVNNGFMLNNGYYIVNDG